MENISTWRRCVSLNESTDESEKVDSQLKSSNLLYQPQQCGDKIMGKVVLSKGEDTSKCKVALTHDMEDSTNDQNSEQIIKAKNLSQGKNKDSANAVIDVFNFSEEEMVTEHWLEDELDVIGKDSEEEALIITEAEKELLSCVIMLHDKNKTDASQTTDVHVENSKTSSSNIVGKEKSSCDAKENSDLFRKVPGLSFIIGIKKENGLEPKEISYHCVLCNEDNASVALCGSEMIKHMDTRQHILNTMLIELPALHARYESDMDASSEILLGKILKFESKREPQKIVPASGETYLQQREKVISRLRKIRSVHKEDQNDKSNKKQITFDKKGQTAKPYSAPVNEEDTIENADSAESLHRKRNRRKKQEGRSDNQIPSDSYRHREKSATSSFNMSEFLSPYQIRILNKELTLKSEDGQEADKLSPGKKEKKLKYPLRELRPVHNIYQSTVRDIKSLQVKRVQNNIVIVTDERDTFNINLANFNDKVKVMKVPKLTFAEAFDCIQTHPNFGKGTVFIFTCGTFDILPPSPLQDCVLAECTNPQTMLTLPQCIDEVHNVIRKALQLHINILESSLNDIALFSGLLPVQVGKYNRYTEMNRPCIQEHSAIQKPKTSTFALGVYQEVIKYYNMFATYHAQTLGYCPWDLEVPSFSILKGEKSAFNHDGFNICSEVEVIRTNQAKLLCEELLKLPSISGVNANKSDKEYAEQKEITEKEKFKYDQIAIITDIRYLPFLSHLKRPGVIIFANKNLNIEELEKFLPKEKDYLNRSTLVLLVIGIHSVTKTISAGVCRAKHCKEKDPLQALVPVKNFDEYLIKLAKNLSSALQRVKGSLPSNSDIAILPPLPISLLRHVNSKQHSILHSRQVQYPLCKLADKSEDIINIYPKFMESIYKISCSLLSESAGQQLTILGKLDDELYKTVRVMSNKRDIDDQLMHTYDMWKDVANEIISVFKNSVYFPSIQIKLPTLNSIKNDLRNNLNSKQMERSSVSYGAFDIPPQQNLMMNPSSNLLDFRATISSHIDRPSINYGSHVTNALSNDDRNLRANLINQFDRSSISYVTPDFPVHATLNQSYGVNPAGCTSLMNIDLSTVSQGLNSNSIINHPFSLENNVLMRPFEKLDTPTDKYLPPYNKGTPAINFSSNFNRAALGSSYIPPFDQVNLCANYMSPFDQRTHLDKSNIRNKYPSPFDTNYGSFDQQIPIPNHLTQFTKAATGIIPDSNSRNVGFAGNFNAIQNSRGNNDEISNNVSNIEQHKASGESINRDPDEIIKFSRTLLNASKKVKKPSKGPNSSVFDDVFIVGARELITPLIECNIKSTMISFNFINFDDSEINDLLVKMSSLQQNSVCCLVFNISIIARKFVMSSGCLKNSCQQPISVSALKFESSQNSNIFEELDQLIFMELQNISKFIGKLSKHIPVIVLPLVPTRIYCEEENSAQHQISHTISDLGFCSVYGSRDLWKRAIQSLTHSWNSFMELTNKHCDACRLVSSYVASNPKSCILLNNVNNFVAHWIEPDVWKAFAETLLMAMVPMKLNIKSNADNKNVDKISVVVTQASSSVPYKFFEELFLSAERNVIIKHSKDKFTLNNMTLGRANLLVKKLNHYHVGDTVLLASIVGKPRYDDAELSLMQKLFIVTGMEKVYQTWKPRLINIIIKKIQEVLDVATLKMTPCDKGYKCQGPNLCLHYHSPQDMRRNPFLYHYNDIMCPKIRRDDGLCEDGVECSFSHNVFEFKFHPVKYQVRLCPSGNLSEICNSQDALCNFAHKDSPELFYTPEWENLLVFGPHHALNFFAGAVRAVSKVKDFQRRVKIILISPSSEFLDVAVKVSDELVRKFGLKVCELDKNLSNLDYSQVLLGNPNSFINLSSNLFSGMIGSIIVDDIQHILKDDRSAEDMRSFVSKYFSHNAVFNKVFVSASYDAGLIKDLSKAIGEPLKQLHTPESVHGERPDTNTDSSIWQETSRSNIKGSQKSALEPNQYSSSISSEYKSQLPSEYQYSMPNEYLSSMTQKNKEYTYNSKISTTARSNEYTATRSNEYPTKRSNEYKILKSNQYPAAKSNEYSAYRPQEYSTTRSTNYSTTEQHEFAASKHNEYPTSRSHEYQTSRPHEYSEMKPTDPHTTRTSDYSISRPNDNPALLPNDYHTSRTQETQSTKPSELQLAKHNQYYASEPYQNQTTGLDQYQSTASNQYQSNASNQYQSNASNHYQSNASNQYQSNASNQYQSIALNQYKPTDSSQYQPAANNHYQSPAPNQYKSSSSDQYQSSSSNQSQSTAFNQYESTAFNQYESTSSNQYQGTAPNQYHSLIPNQYQTSTSSQCQATLENQYQSTTPNQYQSTSVSNYQTSLPIKQKETHLEYSEVKYPDMNYTTQKRSRSRSPASTYAKRSRAPEGPSSSQHLTYSYNQEDLRKRFGRKLFEDYTAALVKVKQRFENEYLAYYENPEMYQNNKVHYETFTNMYDLQLKNISPQHRDGLWKLFWKSKLEEIKKEEWEVVQKNLIEEFERKVALCSSSQPAMNTNTAQEQGDNYSFSKALLLIDRICDNIGFLAPSIKAIIKSAKYRGSNSKESHKIFTEPENVMLINMLLDKVKSNYHSATGAARYFYDQAIDWIPRFLEDAKKGDAASMKSGIDVEAIGKASVGKGSKFALDLIKAALGYEGIQNPDKEIINDLFLKVCAVHYTLANEKLL